MSQNFKDVSIHLLSFSGNVNDLNRRLQAFLESSGFDWTVQCHRNLRIGQPDFFSQLQKFLAKDNHTWVAIWNADLRSPIKEIEYLLETGKGADLIIGSRYLGKKGLVQRSKSSLYNKALCVKVFLNRLFSPRSVADTSSYCLVFKSSSCNSIWRSATFHDETVQEEFIAACQKKALQVSEKEIMWIDSK